YSVARAVEVRRDRREDDAPPSRRLLGAVGRPFAAALNLVGYVAAGIAESAGLSLKAERLREAREAAEAGVEEVPIEGIFMPWEGLDLCQAWSRREIALSHPRALPALAPAAVILALGRRAWGEALPLLQKLLAEAGT
ncbi:hypothetical protein H632_c585p0, partial [Helicosporidium sp. ATCC 50920]